MFLKHFVQANLGIGLCVLVPLPLIQLPRSPTEIFGASKYKFRWLEVLSKGVFYIPEAARIDIVGWGDQMIKQKAYTILSIAFESNDRVLAAKTPLSEDDMDMVINYNKASQFLLESIRGAYVFNPIFPKVTYKEDPSRARVFHDLSTFMLKQIIRTINDDLGGFSELEIRLLRAAESYLKEAINTNENALILSPGQFKTTIVRNIGTAYNNLGLTLNFLGEIEEARNMYEIALKLVPHDRLILENMEAIHRNASYVRQK